MSARAFWRLCSASEPLWRTRRRWRSPRLTTPVLLVRRLVRRRRPVRHQNPRQILHQRIQVHQQLRRPQRLAPRQVRRLKRCRVRLIPKPVRPPHHVMLRRQTHALGWCRVRVARTPALPRRAATPPHQLRRRPPKAGCPLPLPPRRPTTNQPPRRPPSNRPRRHPPQSRRNRWLHDRGRHWMRRKVIRKRH